MVIKCYENCAYYYEWDYGVCILHSNDIVDENNVHQDMDCPYYDSIEAIRKRKNTQ